MLYPKVKEPFFRFALFSFSGGIAGILNGIVLGLVIGFVGFIIAKLQGSAYADASMIVQYLEPTVSMGALFGGILGGVYGIVRKGE